MLRDLFVTLPVAAALGLMCWRTLSVWLKRMFKTAPLLDATSEEIETSLEAEYGTNDEEDDRTLDIVEPDNDDLADDPTEIVEKK